MKAELILQLADFLVTDRPRTHFFFGRWADGSWGGKPDLSCGANACGLGWATVLFPNLLVLRRSGHSIHPYVDLANSTRIPPDFFSAINHSLWAARIAFELTQYQARVLFMPDVRLYHGEDEGSVPRISPYGGHHLSPSFDADAFEVAAHFRRCVKKWQEVSILDH
jgi:hypothetical protein